MLDLYILYVQEFPAFLTIRKLVLMIDGAMVKPFFTRSIDRKVIGTDS